MSLQDSKPRPEEGWLAFTRTLVGSAGLLLTACVVATLVADPLWIWRREPPWLAVTGGVNRTLDTQMRRAKPLQIMASAPSDIVFIGSSTVYRGLRPQDHPCRLISTAYNLGLSSLMAAELPTVAALSVEAGASQVLIGLDYFMFTTFPGPRPIDPSLVSPWGRASALAHTLLSLRTLLGVSPYWLRSALEPGEWYRDGFKMTPDYPAAVTERIAAEQNLAVQNYSPESLRHLEIALAQLRGRNVVLYLSPMSGAQRMLARAAQRWPQIERWRADVAALAGAAGIPLFDFLDSHPFADFDATRGSSAHWIDNMHFKPVVGRWIMERTLASSCTTNAPR
jgi:hypothetical protein